MKSIDNDTEEYQDHCRSRSDNGFDVPECDRIDYEYSAKQMNLLTAEAHQTDS
jgi:hypothetical protein